ncbi:MAG: NAD-dependent deacylase [Chloroflexi bacterium]|nr:NAD-dependent deacylase [Chloroflexota bacterium]
MDVFDQAASLINNSEKLVVFTGAGISTESGISDFRSPGGLWEKYDPSEFMFDKFLASEETRKRYWEMNQSLWPTIVEAQPNTAHIAIAELDQMGKLDCVITQNIDGLHQRAGAPDEKVIELHGTTLWVLCLNCAKRYPRQEIHDRVEAGNKAPYCDDCGGILKPATISFGQAMPERETREAENRSAKCDVFLVIGSSLVVYPAAQMPVLAKRGGAKLIILNMTPTPHDDYADLIIREKAGETMVQIMERLKV